MAYQKELIAAKLRRWEKYLQRYHLPAWEEIPDIGLFMEQVVQVLKLYLDYLPPELKEEQVVTAAAINNYVRTKIMPGPVKKKYYRVHIAYLIMICTLKQSLSISMLQKLVPVGVSEEEFREIYCAYVERYSRSTAYFVEQVRLVAADILDHEERAPITAERTEELIESSAIASGLSKLLAEKLLLLDDLTVENGGSIEIE